MAWLELNSFLCDFKASLSHYLDFKISVRYYFILTDFFPFGLEEIVFVKAKDYRAMLSSSLLFHDRSELHVQ